MTGSCIIYALFYCLAPAGVLLLCRKVKWIGKIGPVLILYILGVLIGNICILPGVPAGARVPEKLLEILSGITVPLAIPLMLFSCTFNKSDAADQAKALISGLVSVSAAVIAGFLIFGPNIDDATKIGGMLTGVFTGGTLNMASLKTMLDVDDEVFILMNTYDMAICFIYLMFLLSAGIKLFRKFLPVKTKRDDTEPLPATGNSPENPYKGLLTKNGIKDAVFLIAVTLIICGISAGIGLTAPDEAFMVVFILMLTTLGLAASFSKKIRQKKYGYDIGMYFIYIFCMSVASMADLTAMDFAGSLYMLGYLAVIVFGSLLLQTILAFIFRIDSDTMVISSVAFINSPPFVPLIAAAMHNKRVLVSGLSIGIIGYAAGNYLGYVIYKLLEIL